MTEAERIAQKLIEADEGDDVPLKLQLGIWHPPLFVEAIYAFKEMGWTYMRQRQDATGATGALFQWVNGVPRTQYEQLQYRLTVFRDETGAQGGAKGAFYVIGRGYVSWAHYIDVEDRHGQQRGDYEIGHGSFEVPQTGKFLQNEGESVEDFAGRVYETMINEGAPGKESLDAE